MRTDGNRIRSLSARLGLAVAALLLAVSATSLAAPASQPAPSFVPSHQVEGAVFDREGGAVAGATVVVRPVSAPIAVGVVAQSFETITDGRGHFALDGLPPGTYWFVAYHGDHGLTGSSPAVPVVDRIEIVVHLDDESISA
jgi:hypothetical protein